jgi:PadR family transcriptional regulator PadR
MLTPEIKKGSAEFLVLSLLEHEPRHGYELSKLIASRSAGVLTFHAASLYPLLYRLEARGWVAGRWVEKPDERRRRYYRITAAGRRTLDAQRKSWREFVTAVASIADLRHA